MYLQKGIAKKMKQDYTNPVQQITIKITKKSRLKLDETHNSTNFKFSDSDVISFCLQQFLKTQQTVFSAPQEKPQQIQMRND